MRLARVATRATARPQWAVRDGQAWALLARPPFSDLAPTGERLGDDEVRLLAPAQPSKVVAVGSNYPKHAAEMGKEVPPLPKLFLKPSTSVIGPDAPIRIPPGTTRVDPEGELAVVIGRTLDWRTPDDQLLDGVLGVTCLNDVTCRDFQRADVQFTRGKGFDTFCPLGPWIETDLDPSDLALSTAVNGEVRARGRTSDMHFDVPTLLRFVTGIMTLLPGDVLATGTPPGVAPLAPGDRVSVTVQGVGTLANPVAEREDRAR